MSNQDCELTQKVKLICNNCKNCILLYGRSSVQFMGLQNPSIHVLH